MEDVMERETVSGRAEQPQMESAPRAMDPWAHRSGGMRCRTCMYFVPKAPAVGGELAETLFPLDRPLGRCRRHAPTMSGYPVVFSSDWCGDHKLDEGKV